MKLIIVCFLLLTASCARNFPVAKISVLRDMETTEDYIILYRLSLEDLVNKEYKISGIQKIDFNGPQTINKLILEFCGPVDRWITINGIRIKLNDRLRMSGGIPQILGNSMRAHSPFLMSDYGDHNWERLAMIKIPDSALVVFYPSSPNSRLINIVTRDDVKSWEKNGFIRY